MAELTLKLHIDPVTGKKTLLADYHGDADALPHEHEEEHRRLVRQLVEGAPLDEGGLIVDREAERPPAVEEDAPEAEAERIAQKG